MERMEPKTLTLTDFLLARIAEDEAQARDDYANGMTGHLWKHFPKDAYEEIQRLTLERGRRLSRECAAKRRIVELRYSWNLQAERTPEPPFGPILQAQVITADSVIRTLASVYSDHPAYRDEWSS